MFCKVLPRGVWAIIWYTNAKKTNRIQIILGEYTVSIFANRHNPNVYIFYRTLNLPFYQHDQYLNTPWYRLPLSIECRRQSQPWHPGSVISTWQCSRMLCGWITNIFFFFAAGVVIAKPMLSYCFLVYFFDSFSLKWYHVRIFCYFWGKWIKKQNNYSLPCRLLIKNHGGTSGNLNIPSFVHFSFLFMNQIAALGRFLVMNALKGIL